MASDILIVDDEEDIRELVAGILSDEGHEARTAYDSDSALASIADRVPRLVFLDIWLQGSKLDGLALLDEIKKLHPSLPVVMISGHGTIETAVSAIHRGAYDFIEKPFKADRLILVCDRALETSKLRREVSDLRKRSGETSELIGTSTAMNNLRQTIERVAPSNSRVMILGPSGAGKELVARTIHNQSQRKAGPFVTINAATITPERMEVELFGIESNGAERKIGALEEAHRGTLYIDEIGDMPRETQNKILRVLVDQQFERVGGSKRVKVDVRIISSTSYDLQALIADGQFREDLYHRLAVVPIMVPGLSERREDIPFLVDHFMRQTASQASIKPRRIGDDAMAVLQAHNWPGNIRQLRNNVERLLILARGDDPDAPITADLLPSEIGDVMPRAPNQSDQHIMALPLREARELFEKEYLVAQINRFGGNISRTAEFIGMERSALHRKLKSLGV
ncbi:MAG: sigma-54-dependent Fis family transcriptional regulator [Rhizobiaceae bacterium]|nr:sigma-54-dependent Fis family transcriptional regulator [Rhizobiaceae bacterium]